MEMEGEKEKKNLRDCKTAESISDWYPTQSSG